MFKLVGVLFLPRLVVCDWPFRSVRPMRLSLPPQASGSVLPLSSGVLCAAPFLPRLRSKSVLVSHTPASDSSLALGFHSVASCRV